MEEKTQVMLQSPKPDEPETEVRTLTCIGCPMGCPLTVEISGRHVTHITGSTCKRGDDYARKEVTNPTRIVTSTVPVTGGTAKMVSVKTRCDIPKEKAAACLKALKGLKVTAPVHAGDILIPDVADTGVDIIATGEIVPIHGLENRE